MRAGVAAADWEVLLWIGLLLHPSCTKSSKTNTESKFCAPFQQLGLETSVYKSLCEFSLLSSHKREKAGEWLWPKIHLIGYPVCNWKAGGDGQWKLRHNTGIRGNPEGKYQLSVDHSPFWARGSILICKQNSAARSPASSMQTFLLFHPLTDLTCCYLCNEKANRSINIKRTIKSHAHTNAQLDRVWVIPFFWPSTQNYSLQTSVRGHHYFISAAAEDSEAATPTTFQESRHFHWPKRSVYIMICCM